MTHDGRIRRAVNRTINEAPRCSKRSYLPSSSAIGFPRNPRSVSRSTPRLSRRCVKLPRGKEGGEGGKRKRREREETPFPRNAQRGKKFEFSGVEFDLQSANIKVRSAVRPGKGRGNSERGHDDEREVLTAPRALAEAPRRRIRLEFVRGVSSAVTSSQKRRQFCFIAYGRASVRAFRKFYYGTSSAGASPPGRDATSFFRPDRRSGPVYTVVISFCHSSCKCHSARTENFSERENRARIATSSKWNNNNGK